MAGPSDRADVLIVEDDDAFAALLQAELAQVALSSAVAPNAETAMELLPTVRPRGVALALVLPGRSGEELLRLLRGPPHAPAVVAVTKRELTLDEEQSLRAQGAVAVLRKGPRFASVATSTLAQRLGTRAITRAA